MILIKITQDEGKPVTRRVSQNEPASVGFHGVVIENYNLGLQTKRAPNITHQTKLWNYSIHMTSIARHRIKPIIQVPSLQVSVKVIVNDLHNLSADQKYKLN